MVATSTRTIMVAQLLLSLLLTTMAPVALALDKTWNLHHSLNGGRDFSYRASVLLSADPDSDSVAISITNDNTTLTKETYLAAKAPGAIYQLKLVEEGGSKDSFVLTSVPGCQLLQSNFRDEIVLTLGPKASVISLTYMPLVSPLAPKSCDHELWDTKLANNNLPDGWESRISWETATPGMALRPITPNYNPPPGLKWLPRMASNGKLYQANNPPGTGEPGEKGGPGGGPEGPEVDNSMMGFFKRYWYIIVPMLIINMMGGEAPAPAPAEGGEGSSASGGGAAQGGAAPTASPGGGGANKKRRGKRD